MLTDQERMQLARDVLTQLSGSPHPGDIELCTIARTALKYELETIVLPKELRFEPYDNLAP